MWSGNFIIARGLNETIPPVTLAFLRWFVAVLAISPFAMKSIFSEWEAVKKHILYLSITSVFGVTMFNTLLYIASHTTSAINLSLISITSPVFIVIFSHFFFGEKISLNNGIGIILVACGVVFLLTKGEVSQILNLSFAVGDIWMLAAAIIFALYTILVKRKPEALSIWSFQLSTFVIGLIFLSPFFMWEYTISPEITFDTGTCLSVLYIGVFASLLAYLLWNKAIINIGPAKAGMIYYAIPLFSGLAAYIFLGENLGLIHLYSALMIIPGIIIANSESGQEQMVRHQTT